MKILFPSEGWNFVGTENSDQRVAFNTHRRFYLDVLTAYGALELTAAFCATDDVLMAMLPSSIEWKRTTTLGRGGDRCDFCWEYNRAGKNRGHRETSANPERTDSRDADTLLARTVGL